MRQLKVHPLLSEILVRSEFGARGTDRGVLLLHCFQVNGDVTRFRFVYTMHGTCARKHTRRSLRSHYVFICEGAKKMKTNTHVYCEELCAFSAPANLGNWRHVWSTMEATLATWIVGLDTLRGSTLALNVWWRLQLHQLIRSVHCWNRRVRRNAKIHWESYTFIICIRLVKSIRSRTCLCNRQPLASDVSGFKCYSTLLQNYVQPSNLMTTAFSSDALSLSLGATIGYCLFGYDPISLALLIWYKYPFTIHQNYTVRSRCSAQDTAQPLRPPPNHLLTEIPTRSEQTKQAKATTNSHKPLHFCILCSIKLLRSQSDPQFTSCCGSWFVSIQINSLARARRPTYRAHSHGINMR